MQDYPAYISSADMSSDVVGGAIPLHAYHHALIVASWTDATSTEAEGRLAAQVSVDGQTWATLVDDSSVALAFTADPGGTGAGDGSLSLSGLAGRYLRVTYTANAGDSGALLSVAVYLS